MIWKDRAKVRQKKSKQVVCMKKSGAKKVVLVGHMTFPQLCARRLHPSYRSRLSLH